MSTRNDPHRQRVYEGEFRVREFLDRANHPRNPFPEVELFGTKVRMPMERKFASVESIQAYCDKVLALPSIREEFPRASSPVRVRSRKGDKFAHCEFTGVIAIPMGGGGTDAWACRELVVLHELAHHLSYCGPHDVQFRYAFVKLVSTAMAPEVGFALQACWHLEGVHDDTREECCA